MNELSDKRAQAALRERRAAIAGEITQPDRHLRHLREPIRRLDATLRLIDPNGDPKAIVGERLDKRVKPCGAGKLNRLILDALRRGERPMTTDEIVASIVAELGYGADAAKGMTNRVKANLAYLARAARVVKQAGGDMIVEIAPDGAMRIIPANLAPKVTGASDGAGWPVRKPEIGF
jgi:hypothetical protein